MHTYDLFSRLVRVRLVGVISGGTHNARFITIETVHTTSTAEFFNLLVVPQFKPCKHRGIGANEIQTFFHIYIDVCTILTHYYRRSHTQLCWYERLSISLSISLAFPPTHLSLSLSSSPIHFSTRPIDALRRLLKLGKDRFCFGSMAREFSFNRESRRRAFGDDG